MSWILLIRSNGLYCLIKSPNSHCQIPAIEFQCTGGHWATSLVTRLTEWKKQLLKIVATKFKVSIFLFSKGELSTLAVFTEILIVHCQWWYFLENSKLYVSSLKFTFSNFETQTKHLFYQFSKRIISAKSSPTVWRAIRPSDLELVGSSRWNDGRKLSPLSKTIKNKKLIEESSKLEVSAHIYKFSWRFRKIANFVCYFS